MARKTHRKKRNGRKNSIGMLKRLTLKIKSLFSNPKVQELVKKYKEVDEVGFHKLI